MTYTKRLSEEHTLIKRMIRILEDAISRMEKGEAIRSDVLPAALDFLEHFADKFHHKKEEDILFKAMIRKGMPEKNSPIEVMLTEHEQGRAYIKNIRSAYAQLVNGKRGAAQDITTNARGYISLLRAHIDKEDNILYPISERMFTEEEKRGQNERFDTADRTNGGKKTINTYTTIIEHLEKKGILPKK